MVDDGYLIGYEDSNGNFVQIGQFNNVADDVTEPIEIVHTNSGDAIRLGKSIELDSDDLKIGQIKAQPTESGSLRRNGHEIDLVQPSLLEFDVSTSNLTVRLPADSVTGEVDWGDGTVQTFTGASAPTHTYGSAGRYQVTITGERFKFDLFNNSSPNLLAVRQWGMAELGQDSLRGFDTSTVEIFATDYPVIESLFRCFRGLTGSEISGLEKWNTSNIKDMQGMFRGASSFNQDISGWDTSSVTNMKNTFNNASSFNQDISGWDTSSVTNMRRVFRDSSFNQDISGWDTSNVTDMRGMFRDSPFNQDIGNWDTSNVTDMKNMFLDSSFNKDIGNWDTSSVTNMGRMFRGSSSFNQDISDWQINSLTNARRMFNSSGLSTANYDDLLVSWDTQAGNKNVTGVQLGASGVTYTGGSAADTARDSLINDHGWTINDGGAV